MEMGKYRIDPDNSEYAGTEDYEYSRNDCFADSARGGDGAVHKCTDAVCKPHNLNSLKPGTYYVWICSEQR